MPHQPDLVGSDLPPAAPGQSMVRITRPATKQSKAQCEFNRLGGRITSLRAHLAQPSQGERLPRKLRAKLVSTLRLLAQAALEAGPDAEPEATHDRHSPVSHRDAQREQADLAASMLGQAMGDEALFAGAAESVAQLMQRTAERMQAQAAQHTDTPADGADAPPGRRPSREDKARARDAQAMQEASQSVREVYRRLASSLHPDREPDTNARARKTTLMARVNDAHARNDLLALLTVQLDIEQIDAEHLRGVSDERLRHDSHVLRER